MSEVGKVLSKMNPLDLLDGAMTVLGFIPGLDIVSDAYFLGRALLDVAAGKGSWADVAMNAAFLLMPVGAGAFKMIKKAVNALDGAADAARTANKVDNLADATKAVGKADDVGDAAKAASNAEDFVGVPTKGRVAVIGEGMDRVRPFASKYGAEVMPTCLPGTAWRPIARGSTDSWMRVTRSSISGRRR